MARPSAPFIARAASGTTSASAGPASPRAAAPAPRAMPASAAAPPAPAPALAPAVAVPAAAAASPERARCAAILNHPEAVGRETLARELALSTDLSPAEAVARLTAAARGPSPLVAAGIAAAATARAALGIKPDAASDLAVAQGVAATLTSASAPIGAAPDARWMSDFEEGQRTARELLGKLSA